MNLTRMSDEQSVTIHDDGDLVLTCIFTPAGRNTSDVNITASPGLNVQHVRRLLFATADALRFTDWQNENGIEKGADDAPGVSDIPF